MDNSEFALYLNRIKLDECKANLEDLSKLQEHHTEYIPFENLDIVVGRKIALDFPHLLDKIILKKRGGYCFELNTLYAELLKFIGFSVKPVLGRVWLSNPKSIPPRNHLAHIVELNGKSYITDVGFGGLVSSAPLDIHETSDMHDKDGLLRVTSFADHQFMIQRQTQKGWTNLYSFDNMDISEKDIEISSYYMSTHPDSHLYFHKCVGRNTKEGRIGLFNNKISTRKGIVLSHSKRVDFGNDWIETLKNDFSLELDFSEKEWDHLFGKNESV